MDNKVIELYRGHPGSGKTTMALKAKARYEAQGGVVAHFEADQFYIDEQGNYSYDRTKVKEAHSECQRKFDEALRDPKVNVVMVSNTFSRVWEMQYYLTAASEMAFDATIIECTGDYKNIHGISAALVKSMKDRAEQTPPGLRIIRDYQLEDIWILEDRNSPSRLNTKNLLACTFNQSVADAYIEVDGDEISVVELIKWAHSSLTERK